MRFLLVIVALVGIVGAMGPEIDAQEPAPWLAVRTCDIKPDEGRALGEAVQNYLSYVRENPVSLPAAACRSYRQRVHSQGHYRLLCEVDSVAQWSEWHDGMLAAAGSDPQRGARFSAIFSHLVPQSCGWSFHQRWP